MKFVIRKGVFETNSSSDHALIFSDTYPKSVEYEYDKIYEITNDPYKKLSYALAFLIGPNLKTEQRPKMVKLKNSFIGYYCKKYKEDFNDTENRLVDDIKKILSYYYSSINIGQTSLQPLLESYWYNNKFPDNRLRALPSDEELKRILIKYFHKYSYVAFAKDQLY